MLYDLRRAKARRKKAQRRELDRPVFVAYLPTEDYAARKEAAVLAWYARVFEFYNVDPAAPSCWHQLAWRLSHELFPNFELTSKQPKVGNPGTREKVMQLFQTFERYQFPRGAGSKYKKFWREHRAACVVPRGPFDRGPTMKPQPSTGRPPRLQYGSSGGLKKPRHPSDFL
jgi:hypothetical protein